MSDPDVSLTLWLFSGRKAQVSLRQTAVGLLPFPFAHNESSPLVEGGLSHLSDHLVFLEINSSTELNQSPCCMIRFYWGFESSSIQFAPSFKERLLLAFTFSRLSRLDTQNITCFKRITYLSTHLFTDKVCLLIPWSLRFLFGPLLLLVYFFPFCTLFFGSSFCFSTLISYCCCCLWTPNSSFSVFQCRLTPATLQGASRPLTPHWHHILDLFCS